MGSKSSHSEEPYRFPGFIAPQYTSVPDILFDELLARLSGAEIKVLLYIIRRTFGFKKSADNISYNQMLKGIRTRDGLQLDQGAGIKSRTTLSKALQRLATLEIIQIVKNSSAEHGNETTTYCLNMGGTRQLHQREIVKNTPGPKNGLGGGPKNGSGANPKNGPPPNPKSEPGLVQKMDPQNTAQQNTVKQKTDVVALLADWGMNQRVAERLASEHPAAKVHEKIAFLEYLLVAEPDHVQHPIGWLRRAIEQDFSAPTGFMTVEELEAEKARQAHITLQRQTRVSERQAAVVNQVEMLFVKYNTKPVEKELWQDVLSSLELSLYAEAFNHLRDSQLLTGQGGKFVIWIEDLRGRQIAEVQLVARIEQELRRCGVEQVKSISFAVEER
ncbi:MAG: replication protein [Ardenticatenaceae bacterium]|nr:replication protein [Ardenticatenaceae bacterium]